MCYQDLVIGRKAFWRQRVTAVAATTILVARADPRRIAITFMSDSGTVAVVSPNPQLSGQLGLRVRQGDVVLPLLLSQVGQAVQGEWYGLSTGAVNLIAWEAILLDDLDRVISAEFKRV